MAAPGAGLPLPELWVARRRFAKMRSGSSRAEVDSLFETEREKILESADACDPQLAGRRVLIKRLRGMEDSSRFWSLWMVLDHLRIVNSAIGRTGLMLAEGRTPAAVASTADVKPDPSVGAGVRDAFDASCQNLLSTFRGIPDLETPVVHQHPWFGALDASGWHALAAFHQRLHRQQIERILATAD